jgi:hypothetical protein
MASRAEVAQQMASRAEVFGIAPAEIAPRSVCGAAPKGRGMFTKLFTKCFYKCIIIRFKCRHGCAVQKLSSLVRQSLFHPKRKIKPQ